MNISLVKELLRCKLRKLAIIFPLLFCGCSSCKKSDELVFLENVMIREGGLYVLMGSKPMCTFPIEDSGFPETEKELKIAYDLYLSEIQTGRIKETPMSYGRFAENCQTTRHLHSKRLWNATQEKLKEYVGPRYRFLVRRNPFDKRNKAGLFLNVPNTLLTLKHYYRFFAEVYGKSFDPEKVIDEIVDENSLFWTSIFRSHFAQGLIFGYGKQNSQEFERQTQNEHSLPPLEVEDQQLEPLIEENVRVSDLRLPCFRVYSLANKKLKKYREEREFIIKKLKGKGFERTVKIWLSKGAAETSPSDNDPGYKAI